ncbi:hypothetical protein QL285_088338 [Trifolium repens]|nr:hypothetical protein QL285_088338 [Trifolium repens]
MAPRKNQAGKRKDQAPPEAEPSKQPKGATTSLRQEREKVVQEAVGSAQQQRKEARKQAKAQALSQAQAHASHSEADATAHSVDLPEGAPGAIPEVQAASSPVAPDLEDGSADSEGEKLSESKFVDEEEEEDVVLLREPTVPKRKKNVKGPLWSDCRFGDVVPVEFLGGPKDKDVLSSYGSHIARYVYEGFDRVELTPISHRRKLRVFDDKNFYVIFSIIISSKMTKTDPNTKENLQKQEKASRQSPRCKKTRKSPKSEEIQHSIAARCVLSCHDESSLHAKQPEEINLEKIFHRSTMPYNAVR